MKDQMKNYVEPEESFSESLKSVVQNVEVNASFKAELGKQLAEAHQPVSSGFGQSVFHRAVPAFGWLFALALMALVLNWMFRSIAPPPIPAAQETLSQATQGIPSPIPTDLTTPIPDNGGYDWRGAKLYLAQPLPQSPAEANIYLLNKDAPTTEEQARAFADRFGIRGEMYTAPGLIDGTTDYVISDGKQLLQVHSDRYFTYISDIVKNRNANGTPNDNAETIIRDFLQERGFDFSFNVSAAGALGGYIVRPLSPDLIPMQYESFTQPIMRVVLDENSEVLSINATLMDYDPTPIGEYGIITAQEALQILLDDNIPAGKMEFFHSPSNQSQDWYRDYPSNQPVTVYGYVTSNPSTDSNKPALILIDGVPVMGNINGMESLDYNTFVEVKGQYFVEGEIRKFNVESWNTNVESSYVTGTLHRQGDQIILTNDDGTGKQYSLVDPPDDVPLDTKLYESQLSFQGVIVDGKMDWQYISYYADVNQSGGGGGGGGLGFYQLNLSGTPIPFPTSTAQAVNNPGITEYTVKEGDTVLGIADAHGTTPEKIFQANSGLNGGVLVLGQTLRIPIESTSGSGQYIVQENDTLASIALNYGVSVDDLAQANGLPDSNLIFVGQALVIPDLQSSTEERVDSVRGFLSISIHKSADGSQLPSYIFSVSDSNTDIYYELEGSNLSELDPYHGLPIIVSGTVRKEAFIPTLSMDSYQIPFPALQFQILKGTQQVQEIDGQIATLFTTETGQTYVELLTNTGQLNFSIIGVEGDLIQQEVLIVPDETFASYPVIRVYSAGMAISPKDGQPMELPLTANQIRVYDDAANPEVPDTTPLSLTIDSIELEYFVNNPYYQVNEPNYERRSTYIQPVWHFQGHYENGDGFDMMIQALKQEFLLPELAPGLSPG